MDLGNKSTCKALTSLQFFFLDILLDEEVLVLTLCRYVSIFVHVPINKVSVDVI